MTQKYAQFNNDGFPTAFYDEGIHGENIPKDAVEITGEQWQEFIDNQGSRIWKNGAVVEYVPSQEVINELNRIARISELKTLLTGSDYWELPTYRVEKTLEQNQANDAQRVAWRTEVRTLENA